MTAAAATSVAIWSHHAAAAAACMRGCDALRLRRAVVSSRVEIGRYGCKLHEQLTCYKSTRGRHGCLNISPLYLRLATPANAVHAYVTVSLMGRATCSHTAHSVRVSRGRVGVAASLSHRVSSRRCLCEPPRLLRCGRRVCRVSLHTRGVTRGYGRGCAVGTFPTYMNTPVYQQEFYSAPSRVLH